MLDAENPAVSDELTASTTDAPVASTADTASTAPDDTPGEAPAKKAAAKRAPAKKTAAKKAPAKKTAAKRTTKKTAAAPVEETASDAVDATQAAPAAEPAADAVVTETDAASDATAEGGTDAAPAKKATAKRTRKAPAKRTSKKTATAGTTDQPLDLEAGEATAVAQAPAGVPAAEAPATQVPAAEAEETEEEAEAAAAAAAAGTPPPVPVPLFQAPQPTKAPARSRKKAAAPKPDAEGVTETQPETAEGGEEAEATRPARPARKRAAAKPREEREQGEETAEEPTGAPEGQDETSEDESEGGSNRRRRRRGGRRRRRSGGDNDTEGSESSDEQDDRESGEERGNGGNGGDESEDSGSAGSRRRRRRRRAGDEGDNGQDDPDNTVTRVRQRRNAEDEITALSGSTRLEAKKQRRREGREAGRRRAPIVSEAEFLARREAVDRVMVIRQNKDLTQIAVLEDKVLVEHYVARESQTSLIGNVYLGRVQNVLPSMEAAFIDIGKGRNAVLYAGEVNWSALGSKDGQPRKIESVLKSGQPVLVQVTKDPIGHKGARLTSQISLPGRFLVYVPDGTTSGISRKLPDTERTRLKTLLKEIVPDSAGVIVRTAAEGASEEELTRDVERLTARWEDIHSKVEGGNAPQLLYGEPDLTLKVVRDLFTEDFAKLVVSGQDAWDMVEGYVSHVAPDLGERLERYDDDQDVFAAYRIDEQIDKALDRKVWLPSGGSLIIDRTEAMTVVDVNTGKFTGSGGNLEETVTKNNLEAAEEIVRQLRLRDIGGIIVVDFIDMVLESNRDLVLRRMVECLGRDRTRHQVAEVTSLGLVQMTRKRIGTGLLEAFSENCEHCHGRGLVVHHEPVEARKKAEEEPRRSRRGGRTGRGRDEEPKGNGGNGNGGAPSPKDVAAMAKHEQAEQVAEPVEPAKATEQRELQPTASGPDGVPSEQRDEAAQEKPKKGKSKGKGRDRDAARRESGPAAPAEAAEPGRPTEGAPAEESRPATAAAETAPEAPAEPAAPVVTTVRRRSVRRAAGTAAPADATAPGRPTEGEPAEAPQHAAAPAAEAPVVAAVETAPEVPPAPPAEPKVVTTVRRRSARRAAGPPSGAAAVGTLTAPADAASGVTPDGSPATQGAPEVPVGEVADQPVSDEPVAAVLDESEVGTPSTQDTENDAEGEGPAAAHVPVKKKGSRKR